MGNEIDTMLDRIDQGRVTVCAECMGACVVEENEELSIERTIIWSSEYGFTVDALELYGDEGRDKLRKAAGRSTYPVIRG